MTSCLYPSKGLHFINEEYEKVIDINLINQGNAGFFQRANPFAPHNITRRLLEAIERNM
ncbi:MAG: hypothetical protein M1326_09625 [Cyanobacteria bacterium]|nr:hypothetical protein [Cyanobacteriota bacterium]